MRIVCQQVILMKYHALIVIFEKVAITTAADDKFCDISPNFRKNKV